MNKADKTIDQIDLIVSRIFDIDPEFLIAENRRDRAVCARFMAIYLQSQDGVEPEELSSHYRRSRSTINHALQQAENMIRHNKSFREKLAMAQLYLNEKRQPYSPDLIQEGVKVWTRPDSAGKVCQGCVTFVGSETFLVESFEDPLLRIACRLDTGRLNPLCESSLDIVSIQP